MLVKAIRFCISLSILYAMYYAGKGINSLFPTGISESILGMILLFLCLVLGIIKVEWISPSARVLTRYMTIFFIPICAEIIEHTELLQAHLYSFVLANVLSTLFSLVVIGLFAQWVFHQKWGKR